jgi:hypothetical protein
MPDTQYDATHTTHDSALAKMEHNAAMEVHGTVAVPEESDIETKTYVVPMVPVTPEMGLARCVTLNSNNQWLELVPRNPKRRNAVVLAVDNDVYLCSSREIAAQVAGSATSGLAFYLPKSIAVPILSQAPYWVACTTTASNSRVSVMVNDDSELA